MLEKSVPQSCCHSLPVSKILLGNKSMQERNLKSHYSLVLSHSGFIPVTGCIGRVTMPLQRLYPSLMRSPLSNHDLIQTKFWQSLDTVDSSQRSLTMCKCHAIKCKFLPTSSGDEKRHVFLTARWAKFLCWHTLRDTHSEYQKALSFYQLPQKFLFPTCSSSAVVQDITPLYKSGTSCNCNYHNM